MIYNAGLVNEHTTVELQRRRLLERELGPANVILRVTEVMGPLLLTWFNFDPSMDK